MRRCYDITAITERLTQIAFVNIIEIEVVNVSTSKYVHSLVVNNDRREKTCRDAI